VAELYEDSLAVIRYHVWWPSTGDPFYQYNIQENTARTNFYFPGSKYVPHLMIDGAIDAGSGYSAWESMIRDRWTWEPYLDMELSGNYDPQSREVDLMVRMTAPGYIPPTWDLRIFVVLTESEVYYGGRYYDEVMRDIIPYYFGDTLTIEEGQTKERNYVFGVDNQLEDTNCELVVFVQNYDSPKYVLQGAKSGLTELQPLEVTIELVPDHSPVVVPRGGSFGFTGTLTNNTDHPLVVDAGTIAIGPEKGVYGWFKKFRDLELAPYETRTAHFDQHVNDRAPLGIYSYIGYCGDYPSSVTDSSFFPIEVTAEALAKAGASDWTLTGSFLEGSTADLPTEFALLGNYPNPFNAQTNISYSLAEAGNVSLKVYDISGRLVGTLVEGFQEAGEYTVTWEAFGASSGIYFYKFNAGEWSETRRMSLIR